MWEERPGDAEGLALLLQAMQEVVGVLIAHLQQARHQEERILRGTEGREEAAVVVSLIRQRYLPLFGEILSKNFLAKRFLLPDLEIWSLFVAFADLPEKNFTSLAELNLCKVAASLTPR